MSEATETGGAVYHIEHETRYVHTRRVSTSQHVACLTPRTLPRQHVRSHELVVDPRPADESRRFDCYGNIEDQFAILTPYSELRVVSRSEVEVAAGERTIDASASPPWEDVRGIVSNASYNDAWEFRYPSPYVEPAPELTAFAREAFTEQRPLLVAAIDLMHRIHDEFQFDPGATTITTPATRVLEERHGVCQDFAHLQIACLRSLGLPARYVSGYLLTDPPAGQPRLVGADASHAWVSVWCPANGWVDLDPTNAVLPDLRHVTIAWGRDYGDVSPLRGVVLGGGHHELYVGVSVVPLKDEL
jgi:transglutaminase-like putative cysteine protease